MKLLNKVIAIIFILVGFATKSDATLFTAPRPPELSPEGKKLVYQFEVGGGREYYDKFLKRITWPGYSSGPTGGIGYDFGMTAADKIKRDWTGILPTGQVNRLMTASGKTGQAGKIKTQELRDILIEWELAESVFNDTTYATYRLICQRIWPGFDELHPNAQAALWSLTFNRGPSMSGPSRVEMREISRLTADKDYAGIAAQIRKMKRLWPDKKGTNDLFDRREREAQLVETAIKK